MPNHIEQTILKTYEATTANGTTIEALVDISRYSKVTTSIKCGGKSGTNPTLDIYFEGLETSGGGDADIQVVPQQVTNFDLQYTLTSYFRKLYVVWTIGGTDTPSFTFGIILYGTIS